MLEGNWQKNAFLSINISDLVSHSKTHKAPIRLTDTIIDMFSRARAHFIGFTHQMKWVLD